MIVSSYKPNSVGVFSNISKKKEGSVSFEAGSQPLYAVKNANHIKKILPTIAFVSSIVGSLGYLIGGTGLYYDLYKEKQSAPLSNDDSAKSKHFFDFKNKKKKQEGVKTITTSTKFGKIGMNSAKVAIAATSAAGMACGLGEGIPLMALGEATNLGAVQRIETPVGTGLFGIGIASIFAGLALDNTPELKLNPLELMAEKSFSKKAKIIAKNMGVVAKEISISMWEILKNIYKPKFIKENILQITPKTVVFREEINKDGKVIVSKMLRHNKNYLMHAASFTLAVGGLGIIGSSLLNQKKSQKTGLVIEEGGFLFDNLGMTKFGLDKLTTGGKSAGASFAIGGIVNALSQFLGLDNKDGRALQWLGIAGVFLGFSIDRGKHLKSTLALAKQRPELTQVVREWKFDLSTLVSNKAELKKLLKEIKSGSPDISNKAFLEIEKTFNDVVGVVKDGVNKNFNEDTKNIQEKLAKLLKPEVLANFKPLEVAKLDKAKQILEVATEKTFGSKNPTPLA